MVVVRAWNQIDADDSRGFLRNIFSTTNCRGGGIAYHTITFCASRSRSVSSASHARAVVPRPINSVRMRSFRQGAGNMHVPIPFANLYRSYDRTGRPTGSSLRTTP
jgi:hypothetical protein